MRMEMVKAVTTLFDSLGGDEQAAVAAHVAAQVEPRAAGPDPLGAMVLANLAEGAMDVATLTLAVQADDAGISRYDIVGALRRLICRRLVARSLKHQGGSTVWIYRLAEASNGE